MSLEGKYRVVILSPELFQATQFQRLLRQSKFKSMITRIIIDEAHTVEEWSSFRPEFLSLSTVRDQIQRISVYATTATLTPKALESLKKIMQMQDSSTQVIQRSNNRPNMDWVFKLMINPRSSFYDLSFLIPASQPNDLPPKTIVFFDCRREAEKAAKYLRTRLAPAFKDSVRWVHALLSHEGREIELERFQSGESRIICGSDAIGMVRICPGLTCIY
jgi:superfamily II DNA helicase RecQ